MLLLVAGCIPQADGTGPAVGGGGDLCLQVGDVEARRPALVSIFVKVETCDGQPVPDLTIANFEILEDGEAISASESRPGIFPVQQKFQPVTLLLLDLSGSVVNAGSLGELKDAASRFVETVLTPSGGADSVGSLAVYWFDGSATIYRLVDFTSERAALIGGLESLTEETPRDDSTNLNGALERGLTTLRQHQNRLEREGVEFTLASLVIFTDGTDRASRVTRESALETLGLYDERTLVQTVGLGSEIDEATLSEFGRDGFEFAENASEIALAFERAGSRIRTEANSFYLVRYCSPRRARTHDLTVRVRYRGGTGEFTERFQADGFGPGCDPTDATGDLLSRDVPATPDVAPTPTPDQDPLPLRDVPATPDVAPTPTPDQDPLPLPDPPVPVAALPTSMVREANFPQSSIRSFWDQERVIRLLEYADDAWLVESTDAGGEWRQRWSSYPQRERADLVSAISEAWDEGFAIVQYAIGADGRHAVLMGRDTGLGLQKYSQTDEFPQDWIAERWDGGYRITSIEYSAFDDSWITVMSRLDGWNQQRWTFRDDMSAVRDVVEESWDEDFEVTEIVFDQENERWLVVSTVNTGYEYQSYSWDRQLESALAATPRLNNPRTYVMEVAYGNGLWFVLGAQGADPFR